LFIDHGISGAFGAALNEERERLRESDGLKFFSYLSRGQYVHQVCRYLELFPRENILFIKFDHLIDNGTRGEVTRRKIAKFIGLDLQPEQAGEIEHANPASHPRSRFVRDILYGSYHFKKLFRLLLPNRDLRALIAHRLDLLNLKPDDKFELGAIPAEIIQRVKEEVENLQTLTDLDLRDWLKEIAGYEQSSG
jgi:hypothetical protein